MRRSACALVVLVVLGVAAVPAVHESDSNVAQSDAAMQQAGFERVRDVPGATALKAVYRYARAGGAHAVILLHELPGLTPGDLQLAEHIAKQDRVTVYVPVLFGNAPQDSFKGYWQACTGRNHPLNCWDRSGRHAIVSDLRALAASVCAEHACGIIGMCLTGSLPLRMLTPNVSVVIMAQPSLPFGFVWQRLDLDVPPADYATLLERAKDNRAFLYVTRHRWDLISSHAAFQRLVARLGEAVGRCSVGIPQSIPQDAAGCAYDEVGGGTHSTLVHALDEPAAARDDHVHTMGDVDRLLRARLSSAE